MNVRISDHPVRLELSVFRASGGDGSVQHANANDVYRYLKASSGRTSAPEELRELLGRNSARTLRSDDDLWREAAAQVMMGQLFLIQQTRSQAGGAAVEAAEAPLAERPKRPGVSPPAPLPPPRKPDVTQAPQPEPELTAFLEQDVQAATLEQAAVNGTPFCEVCEKAKAARAEADAQAGRAAETSVDDKAAG